MDKFTMPFLLFCVSLFILLPKIQANFNSDPSWIYWDQSDSNSTSNGTQVVISPDEAMMAVGFADGTLRLLTMEALEICSNTTNSDSQITDLIWLPSFGPVALDDLNSVTLWSTECDIINTIEFNQAALGIAWNEGTDANGTTIGLVAVNLQDRVEEYNIETGQQTVTYFIPQSESVLEMIYNPDGGNTVLLVGMNQPKIRKFQIDNGTQIDSFDMYEPIKEMAKLSVYTGDIVVGLTTANNIIRFDSTGEMLDRGSFPQSVALTTCPTTKQFALAHAQTQSIGVYLYAGQLQQTVSSLLNLPQDIDCSKSYLVSIDENGIVNVYEYEKFKSSIIAIIGGVLGGLVLLVIGIIVFIKLRKKWALEWEAAKYSGNKPKKYPKPKKTTSSQQNSMQMFKLSTLETTMRE